jgi:dTDP-L-rhamnose 4-epimerase
MAVLRCIEQPSPQGILMNVGSGRPTSVLEVARLLARIMGSAIEPHVTGEYRLGDIRHNFAAIAELERVTGFVPGVSLEAGLRRFVKWVQTQPIPEDQLDRANAELRSRKLMA